MDAADMKRDLVVAHPELGRLTLMHPCGAHRLLPGGSAVSIETVPAVVVDGVEVTPASVVETGPCARWVAMREDWTLTFVDAAFVSPAA